MLNPEPSLLQSGVVRTNCMDTLDRTNVVQSTLAKWTLTQQLRAVGVLQETEDMENFEDLMNKFRNSMSSPFCPMVATDLLFQCGQTTQIRFLGRTAALARSRRTSLALEKELPKALYKTASIPPYATSRTTILMEPDRYACCW